jgi:hypothetical protein
MKKKSGLSKPTKKYKPQGPDLMGEPPSCLRFGVFKSPRSPAQVKKTVDMIFRKALAAKKKAGK